MAHRPRANAAAGYYGAAHNRRLRHLETNDGGPNRLLIGEGETLRARARQLVRGDSHARAAREAWTATMVGEGIKPRPLHPSKERAKEIRAVWDRFAGQCDAHGVESFYGLQELVARAEFEGGEAFIRRRPRRAGDGLAIPLQLEVIESDQLPMRADHLRSAAGPLDRLEAGIEVDAVGRRVAYHFYKRHPRDGSTWFAETIDTTRVPAGDVLHVYAPERPGQLRGASRLAPVIETLWQKRQYFVAEVDRAALASRLTGFSTRPANPDDPNGTPVGAVDETADTGGPNPTAAGTAQIDIDPGTISVLEPGEEIKLYEPNVPGQAFEDFVDAILHTAAAGARVPYELMTGDLRDVNFSSIRAGLRQFAREVRMAQRRHSQQFFGRVWEWFIDAAFLAGELKDSRWPANRADYLAVAWFPPRIEFVDPAKEMASYETAVDNGFMARRQVIEEMGYDPEVVDRMIVEDEHMEAIVARRAAVPVRAVPPDEAEKREEEARGGYLQ